MSLPACFHLADTVLPRVRQETARRLVAAGWSQSNIARALHVSQPMVSRYAAAGADDDALVARLSHDLVQDLTHPSPVRGPGADPWCHTLSAAAAVPEGDALRDLLTAEQELLRHNPVRVVPQIGLNIARLVPGDDQQDDTVLTYPGRLIVASGRIVPPAPPKPEPDSHLAACLHHLRAVDPTVQAVASIRGGPAVCAAAEVEGPIVELPRDDRPDRVALLADTIVRTGATAAIHDPGAFGIEPCLYLADADAAALARRILAIDRRLAA